MGKICYCVAMSLDGYIAGPGGEYDWIPEDPEADVDLARIWTKYDTFLMGRKTYEVAVAGMGAKAFLGYKTVVVSRTMDPAQHPSIRIVREPTRELVEELRLTARKDIWLFGGAQLFRALLDLNAVDAVEVSAMPVLLGEGIKVMPGPYEHRRLRLVGHKVYRSGIAHLNYELVP
jgi:dihydrofolate reductase